MGEKSNQRIRRKGNADRDDSKGAMEGISWPGGGSNRVAKKEDEGKLLKIFGKKGELQEWTQQKGINLKYMKFELFPGDNGVDEGQEGMPAEAMKLSLS